MSIKKENYIVLRYFMVNELKLKGKELLIYAIIHGFSNAQNQYFTGSLTYLMEWTNSSKQGVLNALKALVNKNLISKEVISVSSKSFIRYKALAQDFASEDKFIIIRGSSISDLDLKGNDLLIYSIIDGFTSSGNHFTGTLHYFHQWTLSSKQGILNSLKNLLDRKLILKEEVFMEKVKRCKYQSVSFSEKNDGSKKLTTPISTQSGRSKNFTRGGQIFLMGRSTNLTEAGQKSRPNNIDIINYNINHNIKASELEKIFDYLKSIGIHVTKKHRNQILELSKKNSVSFLLHHFQRQYEILKVKKDVKDIPAIMSYHLFHKICELDHHFLKEKEEANKKEMEEIKMEKECILKQKGSIIRNGEEYALYSLQPIVELTNTLEEHKNEVVKEREVLTEEEFEEHYQRYLLELNIKHGPTVRKIFESKVASNWIVSDSYNSHLTSM